MNFGMRPTLSTSDSKMSSYRFRFVPVVPMKISFWLWFWLILLSLCGVASSFSCYHCEDEASCGDPAEKTCPVVSNPEEKKLGCETTFVGDKVHGKDCKPYEKDAKVDCEGGEDSDTDTKDAPKTCWCFEELCNDKKNDQSIVDKAKAKAKGNAGTKTKPTLWSNLQWIGGLCLYIIILQ